MPRAHEDLPEKELEGGGGSETGPDISRTFPMATACVSFILLCVHGTLVNLEPCQGCHQNLINV